MKLSDKERERLKTLEQEREARYKLSSENLDDDKFRDKYSKVLGGKIRCGFCCPVGWRGLVGKLCEDIAPLIGDDFTVDQVKEKFGGLRFYYSNGNNEVSKLVSDAECESYKVCEECSAPGHSKHGLQWIRTLCDECAGPHVELQYLGDKQRAWGEDEKGLIFANPNHKYKFWDYELKDYGEPRHPTDEESRNRWFQGRQA